MTPTTRPTRRRALVVIVPAVMVAGVLLALFQPWRLLVDQTVDEALPTAPAVTASPSTGDPTAPTAPTAPSASAPAVEELASGTFVSHEHATTGTVRVLRLPDGSRVLRIEGLDTSSGPDVRVWLSDQPVVDGPSGWRVFDDGSYADLGSLKGNKGNQNYAVPADLDLDALTSVSIWCARFQVSFGAAELRA